MKLENQFSTVIQGRRLRELGITAKPEFSHVWYCPDPTGEYSQDLIMNSDHHLAAVCEEREPAFSCSELGAMLPNGYDTMRLTSIKDQWRGYNDRGHDCPLTTEDEPHGYETEAQCRADMLIQLLESGKITPEEVNSRLSNS